MAGGGGGHVVPLLLLLQVLLLSSPFVPVHSHHSVVPVTLVRLRLFTVVRTHSSARSCTCPAVVIW